MSKFLESVMVLKSKMSANWHEELDRIGVISDVLVLYQQGWSQTKANTVLAFIVLAYDAKSGWIQMHKDRMDNKLDILKKLGGNPKDEVFKALIENDLGAAMMVKAWFMEYQKDWRWGTIMTCYDYHAEMMRFGSSKTQDKKLSAEVIKEGGTIEKQYDYLTESEIAEINKKKSENIKAAVERRLQGEDLHKQIKAEFVQLDTVCEKEGFGRMTDATDILSWEKWIQNVR